MTTPPKRSCCETSASSNLAAIHRRGGGTQLPPCCLDDLEKYAALVLDTASSEYLASGGEACETRDENTRAFKKYDPPTTTRCTVRWKLMPDYLVRDVSTVTLKRQLADGNTALVPIGLSPSAFHKWSHKDGELATARGTASAHCSLL